jgi:hypothetical protein
VPVAMVKPGAVPRSKGFEPLTYGLRNLGSPG